MQTSEINVKLDAKKVASVIEDLFPVPDVIFTITGEPRSFGFDDTVGYYVSIYLKAYRMTFLSDLSTFVDNLSNSGYLVYDLGIEPINDLQERCSLLLSFNLHITC